MCLSIPMQLVVMEGNGDFAIVERQHAGTTRRERISMVLLGPQAPGTWVLAAHGMAVETVQEDERLLIEDALAALAASIDGTYDADNHFADLSRR